MRTTREDITFLHPFTLAGLDLPQPTGTDLVVTEEEEITGISFIAWRRVATVIHLPAVGVASAMEQVIATQPQDLAATLTRDAHRNPLEQSDDR